MLVSWVINDYFGLKEAKVVTTPLGELVEPREIQWHAVPVEVRKKAVEVLYPLASEEEKYILIFGEQEGRKFIDEQAWVRGHLIDKDEWLTTEVYRKLGPFERGEFVDKKTSAKAKKEVTRYAVDGRYLVTVMEYWNSCFSRWETEVQFSDS